MITITNRIWKGTSKGSANDDSTAIAAATSGADSGSAMTSADSGPEGADNVLIMITDQSEMHDNLTKISLL